MDRYKEHGLYIIKDKYFADFPDSTWVDNKNESRPYYYAMRDRDGILWMIPMSSQVENCRRKIENIESVRGEGNCVYFHIGVIAGKERAFKIGDMFPVTDEYVLRAYTIGGVPYIVKAKRLNQEIYSKAMRFIKLLQKGQLRDTHGIMGIRTVLLNRMENSQYII